MDKQPEALRLIDKLDKQYLDKIYLEAATELRRLHQVNQELVEALQEMVSQFDQFNLFEHEERVSERAKKILAKHKEQA